MILFGTPVAKRLHLDRLRTAFSGPDKVIASLLKIGTVPQSKVSPYVKVSPLSIPFFALSTFSSLSFQSLSANISKSQMLCNSSTSIGGDVGKPFKPHPPHLSTCMRHNNSRHDTFQNFAATWKLSFTQEIWALTLTWDS